MYVNFEFAALLPSPYSRVKKCAKFKTNIHLVSVDSFFIILALIYPLFLAVSVFLGYRKKVHVLYLKKKYDLRS